MTAEEMAVSAVEEERGPGAGEGEPAGSGKGATEETDDLLGWDALKEATKCLKSVAHPVRLRILELLMEGEYTVGELADLCEVEQATASDHLGRLRDRGILTQDRRGRRVFYRVAAPAVGGIVDCMRRNFGPSSRDGGCQG